MCTCIMYDVRNMSSGLVCGYEKKITYVVVKGQIRTRFLQKVHGRAYYTRRAVGRRTRTRHIQITRV